MSNSSENFDKNSSFFSNFADGSTFRALIDFLHTISPTGQLRFSQTGIKYSKFDASQYELVIVNIYGKMLLNYFAVLESGEYIVCLDMKSFRAQLKNQPRNSCIILSKLAGDNKIYLPRNETATGQEIIDYIIPIIESPQKPIESDSSEIEIDLVLHVNNFLKDFETITKSSSEYVIWERQEEQIVVYADGNGNGMNSGGKRSYAAKYRSPTVRKVHIPTPMFKNLSKIGFTDRGIVKICFRDGILDNQPPVSLIQFIAPISYFGQIDVVIRDHPPAYSHFYQQRP